MRAARRSGGRLAALLFAVVAVFMCSSCVGPDFSAFEDELKFGDETVSDTQVVDTMKVPDGGLGGLIGDDQIEWAMNQGSWSFTYDGAADYLRRHPSVQCEALSNTVQDESPSEGEWVWDEDSSTCTKSRELSWLEKTLWNMYETQSESTIEWLSTSRNTLVASSGTVSTLRQNADVDYDDWFDDVQPYLRVAQAVLVIAAAISLIVLAARIVWNISEGMTHQLLGRMGWIFLGVFLGASCASIALTFFTTSSSGASGATPALQSWTPGEGTGFYVSDWIRLQVDPFLIIAAVLGVVAAGFKLITTQEGRDLIPLGKAFAWAILTAVCLAGAVNLFQDTVDDWSANVLSQASSMMNDAWDTNTLAASQFFELDAPIALVLTIIMWLCGLVSKIFSYLRAGLLPVMVGVAPVFAALSWMETGRQAFGRIMGWLVAFLLYKPVANLVMAAGCAIMVTAGDGDDSQAITLALTLGVIILLPAMIRLIVPAVSSSVGGGGSAQSMMLGGLAGGTVAVAGGAAKAAGKGLLGRLSGGSSSKDAPDGAAHKASTAAAAGAGGDAGGPEAGQGPDGAAPGSQMGAADPDAPDGAASTPPEGDAPDGAAGAGSSVDGVPASGGAGGTAPDGAVPVADGAVPDGAAPSSSTANGSTGSTGNGASAGSFSVSGGAPDGANHGALRRGKEF